MTMTGGGRAPRDRGNGGLLDAEFGGGGIGIIGWDANATFKRGTG